MSNVLEVKNVEKYYGNKSNLTKAIDNISFKVNDGEFVGIMGASGSGKTTLLKHYSYFYSPFVYFNYTILNLRVPSILITLNLHFCHRKRPNIGLLFTKTCIASFRKNYSNFRSFTFFRAYL